MRKEYLANKKSLDKRAKRKRNWRIFRRIFGTFLLLLTVLVGGIMVYAYKEYKPLYDDMYKDAMSKLDGVNANSFKEKQNSVIYDTHGKVLKKLSIHDYHYIKYKQMSKSVEDALLSIEDVRFYEHNGVDFKSLGRASVSLLRNNGEITQGGSTITQQLVKLRFLSLEKTYSRKFEEIMIARELEKRFTKTQILEFYLNTINYGNGAYGIESAAYTYFGKSSSKLSLSQIAFLTGIPNNPSAYNPVTHYDNTIKRRDLILSKMLEYKKISQDEYSKAIKEKIKLHMKKKVYKEDSYAVSFIISSASKELMRKDGFQFKYWFNTESSRRKYLTKYNEAFKEAEYQIRNGGYKIYSTIDIKQQKSLQASVNSKLSGFTARNPKTGLYKLQASATSIDNKTGDVIAIVGGRTQSDVHNTFNRAFLASRQPGSTIKPLLVYLPAFERGVLASNVFNDRKVKNGPANADLHYRGSMTVREAVERSVNTIPYYLINKYQPRNLLAYLEKLEFESLAPTDDTTSVAIGGFTYGTNTFEMASGYSTIARGGQFIRSTGIKKIVNAYEETVYKNTHDGTKVYDSGTSYLMTDVLKGVLTKAHATGTAFKLHGMTAAAKTGTTNNYKDVWFSGYTPYYTTTVWVGYDSPQYIYNGHNYPGAIWKDFMTKLHHDKHLKNKDFVKPDRIKTAYINPYTGDVSDTYKVGWKKQLVTAIYIEKRNEARAKEEAKRKAAAEALKRKKAEELAEKKRLRREELDRLGMTEEDVKVEKEKAYEELNKLIYLQLSSKSDYAKKAKPLIKEVGDALKDVKFSSTYNEVKKLYDQQVQRLFNDNEAIKNRAIEASRAQAAREEEKVRLKEAEVERIRREKAAKDAEIEAKKKAAQDARRQAEEMAKAEQELQNANADLQNKQQSYKEKEQSLHNNTNTNTNTTENSYSNSNSNSNSSSRSSNSNKTSKTKPVEDTNNNSTHKVESNSVNKGTDEK